MRKQVKVYMGDGWRMDFSKTHFDAFSPPDFYARVCISSPPGWEVGTNYEKALVLRTSGWQCDETGRDRGGACGLRDEEDEDDRGPVGAGVGRGVHVPSDGP